MVGDLFFASALTNRTYEARYCTDTLGNVDNLIICPLASYRFQIARSFRLVKDSRIEIEGVHLVYKYQSLSLSSIILNANAFSEIFSIEILGFLQPEKKPGKLNYLVNQKSQTPAKDYERLYRQRADKLVLNMAPLLIFGNYKNLVVTLLQFILDALRSIGQ